MAKLKVYAGVDYGRGKPQVRTIIAATNQKRASELLNLTLTDFNLYFTVSSNEIEIKAALSLPEVVLQASDIMSYDFVRVDARRNAIQH